jgi:uncharacterized protein with NRDE domain
MCLILFAYRRHPDYPLVLIANRDEYYARPTRNAHWWEDAPVLGGRDLEAGGTWLGIARDGRLAAVTNVREPGGMTAGKISRGELTRGFLSGKKSPRDYLEEIGARAQEYAGFNLLLGDTRELWFYSNRGGAPMRVDAGVHGVSNGSFDEPWPKLETGRTELAELLEGTLDRDSLMAILTDHRVADDHQLPSTGVALDIERMLSSRFIRSPGYGTRASTVLIVDQHGEVSFNEQNFGAEGNPEVLVRETFNIGH